MPRYIDAVEAEAKIKTLFPDMPKIDFMDNRENWRKKNKQYLECLDVIRSLKTADVPERNVGKWIEYNYPGAECVYCSKCKEEYYPDDLLLGGNDYPNFCPNCGAQMRERSEDE